MKAKLLIVDDEADIVAMLARHFKMMDYQVITAPSATDALVIMAEQRIDILISDIQMPAMDGVELPEDRLAAGKPEQGLISITVSELPDTITLTIEDDGAGLNREALTGKARKMNLISSNAHLFDDDMVNLLFCAGVGIHR